ncbi:MAG: TMEM165/GDT1 family protein [archaeon]
MAYDLLVPFLAVGLAELGDKTQLAVLCLASKTKDYIQLLLGVMLAFVVADGLAVLVGDYVTGIIPVFYVKTISGIVFIAFGIVTILNNGKPEAACDLTKPFSSGFALVLMSEMGDKTQLATALFSAQYNPWLVFVSVIAALLLLSLGAIYLGKLILAKIDKRKISYAAGGLFMLIGLSCLIAA